MRFGRYEQDGDKENGAEPIEWLVLEERDGKALLISRYALSAKEFKESGKKANWETSDVREWLNGEFIAKAFDEREQLALESTLIDEYLTDHVFLLDRGEAQRYFADDSARRLEPAPAIRKRVSVKNDCCSWWLRSSGESSSSYAMYVDAQGEISAKGKGVSSDSIAVRPAMWVNASKGGFVVINSLAMDMQPGDYVYFGHYEQDGDLATDYEGIEWLVLDRTGNQVTLLSRYLLDVLPYNDTDTAEAVTWEESSLRMWLNNAFFLTAFSRDEREAIRAVQLENDAGNSTSDKVYLLSREEMEAYFEDEGSRIATPTEYARQSIDPANWWWLRSRGGSENTAMIVTDTGLFSSSGDEVNFTGDGIRPAITVDLDAL